MRRLGGGKSKARGEHWDCCWPFSSTIFLLVGASEKERNFRIYLELLFTICLKFKVYFSKLAAEILEDLSASEECKALDSRDSG